MGLLQLNLSYSLFLTPLNYPLIGNLASIALGLECVIIFVCLETFWSFFRKYLQSNRASQEGRNLTWGLLFIGLSCVYIVYIVADYFTPDMAKRDLTNQLAYLILAIGATSTLILTDYIERTKVKIFSIGGLITVSLILLSLVIQYRPLGLAMAFVGIPLTLIYLIFYFRLLLRLANYSKSVIVPIRMFFLSGCCVLLGYILISDYFVQNYGIELRIIGDFLTILGLNAFLYVLNQLPDLSEFNWVSNIQALLVIQESDGICLFSRFFNAEDDKEVQQYLIAGALKSVEAMLQEMSSRTEIHQITLDDKTFLFERIGGVNFVIIANTSMKSLHFRLKQFAEQFHALFSPILLSWNGNLDVFFPAESITDTIFKNFQKRAGSVA